MLVASVQQSDSVAHTHISVLFQILSPYRLLQNIGSSSLHFPGGLADKELACNGEDLGLIPGLGRSPEEENSYSLQYSGCRVRHDWATFTFFVLYGRSSLVIYFIVVHVCVNPEFLMSHCLKMLKNHTFPRPLISSTLGPPESLTFPLYDAVSLSHENPRVLEFCREDGVPEDEF